MTQNCWIFGVTCRSDEAYHLLLPFPVLRSLRSLRLLRSLQTLRTIRSICSIRSIRVQNSIREIRVQKQNVGFAFRLVYSFERSLCRVLNAVLSGSVYSLNVGFVYSLCIVCASNYTFRNARKISEM